MTESPLTTDVRISDETIKLGQFLKLADLVESGSAAKPLLAGGMVRVNDVVETRRGRQLVARRRRRGGAPIRPCDRSKLSGRLQTPR